MKQIMKNDFLSKLLLAKRFAQSDFMQKPAALAVIDLADSCSIFE
jgi:hypothetical protein